MLATNIKDEGYSTENLARDIVMRRSSKGWRNTSRTERLNSGNSSRKSTPLCAKDISPGCGTPPPPTSATSLMVWCGERKGLIVIREEPEGKCPETECILVLSSAS